MTSPVHLPQGDSPGGFASEKEKGKILVVDDEPGIRKMIRTLLGRHGFGVLEAGDGVTATGIYRSQPESIGLALIDLVMPLMDGIALATELKRLNPRLAVVVTSGIDFEHRIAELTALGITDYLHKPFQRTQLLEVVTSALNRPG